MFCLERLVLFVSLVVSAPQSSLLYTPFERDTRELEFIRILNTLCASLISFELDNFCSSASLISCRARWWFYFIEIIDLSCFTYIILRVLNSMVICFNYDRHSRLVIFFLMSVLNTMRNLILDNCFETWRW